jgi:hypothetical protein
LDPKLDRNFLLVKEDLDPYPDPKLGQKWDPDPKKIVSDPQHWPVITKEK